jgi:ABC-type bacteriocin/lantibiotic exporter with double-glycine peptidase domain
VQLLNGTLAQNIALGETEIDEARVEAASKAAGIHRFADERLPQRYGTLIGDGGHTLSSGERQRVGIARALYHSPAVLLLDEATNELDAATEDLVLSHLLGRPDTTIVFVTHKQALWKRADTIIQLAGNSA